MACELVLCLTSLRGEVDSHEHHLSQKGVCCEMMCGLLTLPWWSLRCFSKPGAAGSGPRSPRPLASHVEWKARALSGQQVTQVCMVLQVGTGNG